MSILQDIIESYDDETFLKADGFDEAIIGVDEATMRLIYSVSKCLDILIKRDGLLWEEAVEHFNFNVSGAYMGVKTPIWCEDQFESFRDEK